MCIPFTYLSTSFETHKSYHHLTVVPVAPTNPSYFNLNSIKGPLYHHIHTFSLFTVAHSSCSAKLGLDSCCQPVVCCKSDIQHHRAVAGTWGLLHVRETPYVSRNTLPNVWWMSCTHSQPNCAFKRGQRLSARLLFIIIISVVKRASVEPLEHPFIPFTRSQSSCKL